MHRVQVLSLRIPMKVKLNGLLRDIIVDEEEKTSSVSYFGVYIQTIRALYLILFQNSNKQMH